MLRGAEHCKCCLARVIEIPAEGGPLRLPIDEVVDDGRDIVDPAESIIEGGLVGIHRRSSPMLKANEETC